MSEYPIPMQLRSTRFRLARSAAICAALLAVWQVARSEPQASEDHQGVARSEPQASEDHQGVARSESKASEGHQGVARSESKASEGHQEGGAEQRSAERVVVCLGDSLTEGYGLAPDQSYPSLLERMLRERGHAVRVVNAGISGSTSASAASRLRWQLRSRPDVVVIALGGNDGLRGVDVAATKANLSAAIELAQQSGARVLLAGMKLPPNYGPEYTAAFEALFSALAVKHEVALLPFLLEGVAANPELNLPDGIHPNARGTEIVARNVLDALQPLLAPPQARP